MAQWHNRSFNRRVAARARRAVAIALCVATLGGCESLPQLADVLSTSSSGGGGLTSATIADGLRQALEIGSKRAVDGLGRKDGFFGSPYQIPLPKTLQRAREIASPFGIGGMFDDLQLKMNRAAESAAPKAGALFIGAIKQMTFDDVMQIYRGGDDAATRFLRRKTESTLNEQMRPVVDSSLSQVGAVNAFNSAIERFNKLPLVDPVKANLSDHVLGFASDALFQTLAKEEAAIRTDPVKRTTDLLKTVFGAA